MWPFQRMTAIIFIRLLYKYFVSTPGKQAIKFRSFWKMHIFDQNENEFEPRTDDFLSTRCTEIKQILEPKQD